MSKSLTLALIALGIGFVAPVSANPLSSAPAAIVTSTDDGVVGTAAQSDAEKDKKKKKKESAGSGSDKRGS